MLKKFILSALLVTALSANVLAQQIPVLLDGMKLALIDDKFVTLGNVGQNINESHNYSWGIFVRNMRTGDLYKVYKSDESGLYLMPLSVWWITN